VKLERRLKNVVPKVSPIFTFPAVRKGIVPDPFGPKAIEAARGREAGSIRKGTTDIEASGEPVKTGRTDKEEVREAGN